ncbi:hypothetical protein FB567DRAFT_146403 [Paraphoma chrysanthemicola]|uniref:DH domain-containing protein n=1 Tax=Paraphoma chrysanthemicola TaxID=798071 RepID=A0A8K0QZ95_9PLEO|nr:hypothetical protein FB567DRAFT_146403 [Paraphoma chrysanthemicola]
MAESDQVHNYAYPSVASWLHSTSLAQLEGAPEPKHVDAEEPLDASPDDFYKSAYTTTQHEIAPPQPADMAASRVRQPTANGTVRPPSKSTPRSASGPASSVTTTRSSPQVSNKVKALAERFERSPGGGVTAPAPAVRSRSRDPIRGGAYDPARRSGASMSSTASAARPSKEAAYGTYKFNNLKPRERPQPAPASPRNTTARRTTGSRSSLDQHMSPTRKKVASPSRRPASSGRQPFFGEVVSGQDLTSPGFGIPIFDGTEEEVPGVDTLLEAPAEETRLPASTFKFPHHERSGSAATSSSFAGDGSRAQQAQSTPGRVPVRPSPTSRIPVRARRLSATSDTSSSSRSVKYTPTRASNHSNRASPTRMYRKAVGAGDLKGPDQSTLPALAYRGYRERGKSPAGPRNGPGVAASSNAPPAPASPRLRNSRERQIVQHSPVRDPGPHAEHGYFPDTSDVHHGPSTHVDEATRPHDIPHTFEDAPRESPQDQHMGHQQRLSLQTSHLSIPPIKQPPSATTDFEESPILGIPGSFVLTPPTVHEEAQPQLLQPTVFHTAGRELASKSPEIEQSELGVRESIPIMLGEDQSPRAWQPDSDDLSEGLRALDYSYGTDRGYPTHYEMGDSPIDPFSNRDTLQPDDSASIAPYRAAGPLTFNRETYSVVNSVLNMYHQSPVISPELASVSRERVQRVSPVIAQHKDWGSKEATETYLARLLSDANGGEQESSLGQEKRMTSPTRPILDLPLLEEESPVNVSGTAIIYPPESRRYSRGSRGSTTTTIQDDASRSGSSSGNPSQDHLLRNSSTERTSTNGIQLPQLAWTNGGLGLSYHEEMPPSPSSQHAPPRPAYSPPPPPPKVSIDQHTTPLDAPQPPYSHHYPLPSIFNEQVEQHPARALTPVNHAFEEGLEARYGVAQSPDMGDQLAVPAEATEDGAPDPAKQALTKRYRILEELLTTEHQFCIDMMIAHNIFEATAQTVMTEKEKKILFSNCKELEKFSLSLFRAFKKAAKPIVNYDIPPPTGPWNRDSSDSRPSNPSDASLNICRPSEDSQNQFENCTLENDHQTTVGQVFLDNKEKMERLYTTYYLNQENAAAYIKKHQNNPELSGWVTACFEQVENMTQAWDLDSLLLKPCQRLLKYPLLLDSLEGSSDPDHPDMDNIKEARKELLAMSARINEAKKRADTFRAATSEGKKEKTKGKGIGKTFVKAFIPKVDKNKAYDEADKTFKDQDYKSREQKFGGHFFQLQIVIRDFEQYLDAITEHYQQLNIVFMGFVTVCEVAPSVHPELESTWRKWAMAHFELQNKALEDHKAAVRSRVLKPVADLWEMWVAYQKTIEQRKKFLLYYVKHKQAVDRGEKVDADLEESSNKFTTINDTLKHELPLLYERTKGLMRTLMTLFMCLQKDWYKTCSKKILPLLESEPQHTTSLRYDLESYVERFNSDYKPMQDLANRLGIVNRNLLIDISNMTSPVPTLSSDGGGSSRNSTNRRTESMSSEASMMDSRNRHSGGYAGPNRMRPHDTPPRSSPAGMAYPSLTAGRSGLGPTSLREARALSPVSDDSEATVMHHNERRNTGSSRNHNYLGLDGAVDFDDRSPFGSSAFDFPPQLGASFLAPVSQPLMHSFSAPTSQPASLPGSQRASGIFSSALPMSDSPVRGSVEELPPTPGDSDEPEVLFLAASLFEFNIAHDRREGGIPYLVYVPGEIFDVIGMKGELWLARNQDDPTKTVGWIWEKHFARILPEDA